MPAIRTRYDSTKGRMEAFCARVIPGIGRMRQQGTLQPGRGVARVVMPRRPGRGNLRGPEISFGMDRSVASGEAADG